MISKETQRDSNWNWNPWALWMLLRKIVFSYTFEEIFYLWFYNKCTYYNIKIAVLISSITTYTAIYEGKTPKRRILVTSSLNEIPYPMDQLGNGVGMGVRRKALQGKYLNTTYPIFSPKRFTSCINMLKTLGFLVLDHGASGSLQFRDDLLPAGLLVQNRIKFKIEAKKILILVYL